MDMKKIRKVMSHIFGLLFVVVDKFLKQYLLPT